MIAWETAGTILEITVMTIVTTYICKYRLFGNSPIR
jgi:hypothetical protein